jgi:hypothetical protein
MPLSLCFLLLNHLSHLSFSLTLPSTFLLFLVLTFISLSFYVSFPIFTPTIGSLFSFHSQILFPSTFHTTLSVGLFLSSIYSHAFRYFRLWFLPRSDSGGLLSAVTVFEVTNLFALLTYLFYLH